MRQPLDGRAASAVAGRTTSTACRRLRPERRCLRRRPARRRGGQTVAVLWHENFNFFKDRKSAILGVWAAPGAPETLPKGGGLRPPPFGRVSGALGAAQTPNMADLRPFTKFEITSQSAASVMQCSSARGVPCDNRASGKQFEIDDDLQNKKLRRCCINQQTLSQETDYKAILWPFPVRSPKKLKY